MQNITFTRVNGNIPKRLAGQDHISGLLYYIPDDELPVGFSVTNRIQLVSTIETAETLGITSTSESWHLRNLHYHLSQIYRLNNGVTLYLGLFPSAETATFTEVKQMQSFAGGDIRQIGVYNGSTDLAATDLVTLQGVATQLESEDTPLMIIYSPNISAIATLPTNLAGENKRNVSVVIAQDMEGVAKSLFDDAERNGAAVGAIGLALGIVSAAKVHQSIAWVAQFPTGATLPGFVDGTLLRSLDRGVVEALDNGRYLFLTTYSGIAGCYWNDSHNMDSPTSDYAYIELVRTIDKAVRGIRTYLLPELGSPLQVDAETGQLARATVGYLQNKASLTLEDMARDGELNGYIVEIDPEQNVLATSTVEFYIKNVPLGVFRKGSVKIGYAQSV